MSARQPHIFISCGEASGDRYGAALTAALRSSWPEARISGMGGALMRQAGVQIVQDPAEVAIMGFTEVVGALRKVVGIRGRLMEHMRREKVTMVIPIDFPGFNGEIAARARRAGLPVFWLVAPQHWAWGGWRSSGFRKKIDRLGTILPFEEEFFLRRGFDVFAMGHPLMEDYGGAFPLESSISAREKRLISRDEPLTIGILPGSRKQELKALLPILKVTGQALLGHLEGRETRFLVSCASGVDPIDLTDIFNIPADITQSPLSEVLPRMDLALVCSGTASLETALAGVPHELVYRTGQVNHFLAKLLVRTSHIGLSNLIMDEPLVREHIQEQAAPLPLARDLLRWIVRPAERQQFYSGVRRLRKQCGDVGVWERTAAAIRELAGKKRDGR